MKHSNNVHLDGAVDHCLITGEKNGFVVARMEVFTLTAKSPDLSGYRPAEKFEKSFHRVRVAVKQDAAEPLRALDAETRSGGIKGLHTVSIDGSIAQVDGSPVIDVRGDGVRFTDKNLPNTDNNKVSLSGTVRETTFTDMSASMVLDVDKVPVRVRFLRSTNPKGWEDVKEHRIGKGDEVSLEGPLISRKFSDGKKELFDCSVAAKTVQLLKLAKEEKRSKGGVSL